MKKFLFTLLFVSAGIAPCLGAAQENQDRGPEGTTFGTANERLGRIEEEIAQLEARLDALEEEIEPAENDAKRAMLEAKRNILLTLRAGPELEVHWQQAMFDAIAQMHEGTTLDAANEQQGRIEEARAQLEERLEALEVEIEAAENDAERAMLEARRNLLLALRAGPEFEAQWQQALVEAIVQQDIC